MTLLIVALVFAGTFLMFLTGLGLVRMPDVFTRMHAATKAASLGVAFLLAAATKAASLGVAFLLAAAALHFGETGVGTKAVATIIFIFLTAPVAASVLGRAAYARRIPLWDKSVMDEGRDHIDVRVNPVAEKNHADRET